MNKFYKVAVRTEMICGTEYWAVDKNIKRIKMSVAEMIMNKINE